jgi:hypothetical protein
MKEASVKYSYIGFAMAVLLMVMSAGLVDCADNIESKKVFLDAIIKQLYKSEYASEIKRMTGWD